MPLMGLLDGPALGQRYRLPSGSVVEVVRVSGHAVACRYLRCPWFSTRKGLTKGAGDLALHLGFLAVFGEVA